MTRIAWLLATLTAVIATGCGDGRIEPVAIAFNEEVCSHCRMAVSEPTFAAEVVGSDGSLDYFDDIGCMVLWTKERRVPDDSGLFVVDYQNGNWLDARDAYFVRSEALDTPMGFGIAAAQELEPADSLAEEIEGQVVGWSQLLEETR
jgi:copper chaperone NosL